MVCFEIVHVALFWDRKQHRQQWHSSARTAWIRVRKAFRKTLVSSKSVFQLLNQNAGLPMIRSSTSASGNNDVYC